ncbi:ADP-ribosylation [Glarea lozoyensis ATCC 20868]|uniref:ADP-ribosylation n=1 Tax=Glarea lozoyensis (strain ATCC 20868 / MF5171) TaxID=1116229 RepID=S3DIW1_GLAL2|nr:ADP-ribosylation [Glarea lozoyensis ATCC 20868]EPE31971.1 ADP-ribosylation [Glarea lozoyensis ATCC 20868]
MEARTPFDSAIDDWYRQPENVEGIIKTLEEKSEIKFVFRKNQVVDGSRAGDHQIEASAEHIARWDTRVPENIFKEGFAPRTPRHWTTFGMHNFKSYQQSQSVASVFVATARCFQDDKSKPAMWKPQNWNDGTKYKYAVSGCYGGIDVNATIAQNKASHFKSEHEITFVGGIRKEFIPFAVEYKDGVAIKIWENGQIKQVVGTTFPRPPNVDVYIVSP